MAGIERARVAKAHLATALQDREDVRGIGIRRSSTDDGFELQVNLVRDASGVPRDMDGVDVRVRVVGALHPQH